LKPGGFRSPSNVRNLDYAFLRRFQVPIREERTNFFNKTNQLKNWFFPSFFILHSSLQKLDRGRERNIASCSPLLLFRDPTVNVIFINVGWNIDVDGGSWAMWTWWVGNWGIVKGVWDLSFKLRDRLRAKRFRTEDLSRIVKVHCG